MIVSPNWAGKRYAVLGLARSGSATVRALVAGGASVVAWDSDEVKRTSFPSPLRGEGAERSEGGRGGVADGSPLPLSPTLSPGGRGSLVVADLDTFDLAGFDALVVSPGVPLNTHPLAARARAAGVPIIGDIELFAEARASLPPHKVVGITGTNGKSTTTALVHHILKTAGVPSLMGGNIGLPILEQEPLPEGGVYVVELSSYQIDLTFNLDCEVAVLTNITPDHLDRYDSFEAYAASKGRLFEMSSGAAVIAVDDDHTRGIATSLRHAGLVPASRAAHAIGGEWAEPWTPGRARGDVVEVSGRDADGEAQRGWPALQGPHNAQNMVVATVAARILGIGAATIAAALRTFTGLPHRMEHVATRAGVAYVDDSKATNPESAAPALAAFRHVHWIVGGRAKGGDLDACAPHFGHVRRAYTIGEAGPRFAAVLAGKVPVEEAGTLEIAVTRAAANAVAGETVLLSPACASFDQFSDYAARGLAFRRAVEALAA